MSPADRLVSTYPPAQLELLFNHLSSNPLFICTNGTNQTDEDNLMLITINSTDEAISCTSSKVRDAVFLVHGEKIDHYQLIRHGLMVGDLSFSKDKKIELIAEQGKNIKFMTSHLDQNRIHNIITDTQNHKDQTNERLNQRFKP